MFVGCHFLLGCDWTVRHNGFYIHDWQAVNHQHCSLKFLLHPRLVGVRFFCIAIESELQAKSSVLVLYVPGSTVTRFWVVLDNIEHAHLVSGHFLTRPPSSSFFLYRLTSFDPVDLV